MDYDYEKDLEINEFKLQEEWQNQPSLYMKYATASAAAKKEMDEAWEHLKVTKAELIKEANEEGAKNDAAREAYYRTDKRHKEAKQEKIDAEYNYNILNHVVYALSQRKTALENLVRLWAGEYYSTPTVETKEGEENFGRTVKKKSARAKVKKSMRSKNEH